MRLLNGTNMRTAYLALLTTSAVMAMTFWRVMETGNYVVYNIPGLNKDPMYDVMQKNAIETCNFKWRMKNFDPEFYEARGYNSKRLHTDDSAMPIRTGQPVPVNRNPLYKLDPDKFLMVQLIGGPNNQIFCLRETIFIAIKMNRTVVIPKFFKHFTDDQADGTSYVYPGHRINLDDVCDYVSCITQKQFQETCGGKVDAVLALNGIGSNVGRKIEEYTGMRVFRAEKELDVEVVSNPKGSIKKGKIASTEIREKFYTQARCLVYYNPLFNLLIRSSTNNDRPRLLPALRVLQEGSNTSDTELMRTITKHTQAPKYIGKLAANFIKFLTKNRPLVTVHWRYNRGDYLRRCQYRLEVDKIAARGQSAFCKEVLGFGSKDLARNIEEVITTLPRRIKESGRKISKASNIRDIYIASPPSERETVENVSRILQEKQGWKVYSSIELEKYVTDTQKSCDVTSKHLNDIVSTLEMEICARGFIFLSSKRSTWSGNTKLSRDVCTRDGTHPDFDDYVI